MADAAGQAVAAENDRIPYVFFFSYARADYDVFLERFFKDLNERTADLLELDQKSVSFLDTDSVETGQDWNTRIAAALQFTKVLVCVYTPNFFSRSRKHEYCAKEFDGFLKRDAGVSYERIVEGGRETHRIRDARNIVPILWMGEPDLLPEGLPPAVLGAITYSLNRITANRKISDEYHSKGMERFAMRRGTVYRDVIAGLARLIRDYARAPLPPLPQRPEFASLRNVFWDPPVNAAGTSGASQAAAPLEQRVKEAPGPRQLLAIEIRSAPNSGPAWTPYANGESLSDMIEDIAAARRLVRTAMSYDPATPGSLEQLQNALETATTANVSIILLVDPQYLAGAGGRAALGVLIENEKWRGGILLPMDSADRPARDIVEQQAELLRLSPKQQERIAIRRAVGSAADFPRAMIGLLDDIAVLIVKHGQVQRDSPDNAGPDKRPTFANADRPAAQK